MGRELKSERDECGKKLAGNFRKYIEDTKESCKCTMGKLEEEIAMEMARPCSKESIRGYMSYISENRVDELANACIRFEVKNHFSRKNLKEFIEKYTDTLKEYKGRELELDNQGMAYIYGHNQIMTNEDIYRWKQIFCPSAVTAKLDNFLANSEKRCLYISGTYYCGMTGSVTKYFMERQKNGTPDSTKVPYIFDIEEKSTEYILSWDELQESLSKDEYVIIRTGYMDLPEQLLLKGGNAKIIVLSHCPVSSNLYCYVESIVFDDLVGYYKTVQELIENYVPDLYNYVKNDRIQLENLVRRIKALTGGIPVAVREIGNLILEEYRIRGNGLNEILNKEPWQLSGGCEVYDRLWKNLIENVWKMLSADVQEALKKIMYFNDSIGMELLWYLCDTSPEQEFSSRMKEECFRCMILIESSRYRNGNEVSFPDVRIFPMHRQLLKYHFKDCVSVGYECTMKKVLAFYCNKSKELDVDSLYKGNNCFLDRPGEFRILNDVLNYCDANNLYSEYMSITANLNGFFYLRVKYVEEVKRIYNKRLKMAQKNRLFRERLITYGYILNRCVKRGEKDNAKRVYEEAESFLKKYKNKKKCYPYLHAKALYYFGLEGKYKEAKEIWEDLLLDTKLTMREKESAEKWVRKCEYKLKELSLEALCEKFEQGLNEVKGTNNIRAQIDYGLHLSRLYIEIFLESLQKTERESLLHVVMEKLKEVENLLDDVNNIDDKYRAFFWEIKGYLKKLQGESCEEELSKAFGYYTKFDRVQWFSSVQNYLEKLDIWEENRKVRKND